MHSYKYFIIITFPSSVTWRESVALGIDKHRFECLLHPLLAAWVTLGSPVCPYKRGDI